MSNHYEPPGPGLYVVGWRVFDPIRGMWALFLDRQAATQYAAKHHSVARPVWDSSP